MKLRKSSRFVSLVLSAVMVLAMLPSTAFAAEVGVATGQAFKEATVAATNGTVIKLTAEIRMDKDFTIANNANFTIDLNGQAMRFDFWATICILYTGTGALTIIDSSANQTGKITSDEQAHSDHKCIIENRSTGTINFVSGSMYSNYAELIRNTGTGTINISGGTMRQEADSTKCMIVNHSTGIINISGGTLSATAPIVVQDKTNGQINISGGTISSGGEILIWSTETGAVNISGGTITATGDRTVAVYMKHGKLTVSQANDNIPTVISSISTIFGTLAVSDWEIPQRIIFDIQSGTIINTGVGGKAIAFDGRSNVTSSNLFTFLKIDPRANIQGSIRPAPLQSTGVYEQMLRNAVANATEGSTIALMGDTDLTTGTLAIAKNMNITFDLRGYSLGKTGDFDTITYSGTKTLNIIDNSAEKTGLIKANGPGTQNAVLRNTGTGTISVKDITVQAYRAYPAIINETTGKIIIGGAATISSPNDNTTNGGTIRLNAVPTSGDKLVLDIQGGKVESAATGGYSIYFVPELVTTENIDDYLRIAPNATIIGKSRPAAKPVFKAEYNVAGGSGSRLERSLNELVSDAKGGITATDKAGGNSVSLKLTVAEKTNTDTAIEGLKQGDSVQYYDVTVEKIVTTPEGTSTPTVLTSIPKPVRAIIPVPTEIQGKTSYTVYRIHGGVAEKIPHDPTAVEFYTVNPGGTSLTLNVNKFSTYAVITNNKSLTGDHTFGDAANPKSSAVDVQGKVIEGMFGVYKLDISWGAMKFDYNAQGGVWNPDTHTYTPSGGTKGWTNESFVDPNNKITVANHSNGDVTLSYTATADAILAGATMTVRANNSLTSVLAENLLLGKVPAESGTVPTIDAFVWLTGDPTGLKSATYTKAGVITITAEPDTAGGLTPKNPTP